MKSVMFVTVCVFLASAGVYFHKTPQTLCVFLASAGVYFHKTPQTLCVFLASAGVYFHKTPQTVCVFLASAGVYFLKTPQTVCVFLASAGVYFHKTPQTLEGQCPNSHFSSICLALAGAEQKVIIMFSSIFYSNLSYCVLFSNARKNCFIFNVNDIDKSSDFEGLEDKKELRLESIL